MSSNRDPVDVNAEKPLRVRRGKVDSVDLYEIKDSELDLLEKGSPSDLQLNFAIFLLSIAFSAICSLATATFASQRVEILFLIVSVVGILIGAFLLFSWYRSHVSLRDLCAAIRRRMPPEPAALIDPPKPGAPGVEEHDPAG